MEKIKINLPGNLLTVLEQDMQLFEFFKKDGSLNRNDFYNQLIVHYYDSYNLKQQSLINQMMSVLNEQMNASDSIRKETAFLLLQQIQNKSVSESSSKLDKTINLKPTRYSESIIEFIEGNLHSQSLSSYFRNMFTEYVSLPRNQREKIIFQPLIEKINRALDQKSKIMLKTKSENARNHIVSPYKMIQSKEEFYNYLLCAENTHCVTFRLTRIKDIMIINEPTQFESEQIQIFNKMIEHGPQFAYTHPVETIIVKLTDLGKKMYKSMYVQRPVPFKVEDDLYYFDCSSTQIMHYFKRFGTSAVIISPLVLTERMTEFYELGAIRYRKILNRSRKEQIPTKN